MKVKNGRKTITTEIAYLAGFFDGEGCIRIKESNQGGNSFHIIAHVTNSNYRTLTRFQDLFGGQIRKQERTPNKTIFNFYITSSEACDMLKVLTPFMEEKLAQAGLAIKFHENKEDMTREEKLSYDRVMREMKKYQPEIIGNIYENPELLDNKNK